MYHSRRVRFLTVQPYRTRKRTPATGPILTDGDRSFCPVSMTEPGAREVEIEAMTGSGAVWLSNVIASKLLPQEGPNVAVSWSSSWPRDRQ
jgi:hypothetical protein